ncbi:hypothetical protein BGZ82_006834 [Podila clonocystis]|nr:hypothetical protein BGZ82_006834 [Podila clonocystis]
MPPNRLNIGRLPSHFQLPEERWGDLDKYVQSIPPVNTRTHMSQLFKHLDEIIRTGNDAQTQAAKNMKSSITAENLHAAIKRARVLRMTNIATSTVKTQFTEQTYTEVGKTLSLVRQDILESTNELAQKNKRLTMTSPQHSDDDEDLEVEEDVFGPKQLSDKDSNHKEDEVDLERKRAYLSTIPCSTTQLEVFLPLGQSLGWNAAGINLLKQLVVAQHDRTYTEYSLTRDAIADLSPKGDFTPFLGPAYKDVLSTAPKSPKSEDLAAVLNKIVSTNELPFHKVLENSKALEREPLKDLVCQILGQLVNAFPLHDSPPSMNERQFFQTFVLPLFQNAFRMQGLFMQTFEVQVLGCCKRINRGREPLIDKVAPGHFADAVVVWNGMQPVIMEAGPPADKDQDKVHTDHYKLARDMKDTWRHCVERLAESGKQPPRNLKVFGVQSYEDRVDVFYLTFLGCFPLQMITSFTAPANRSDFGHIFRRAMKESFGFAQLVAEEVQRWRDAPELETPRFQINMALEVLPATHHMPIKIAKGKRRRDDIEE